MTHLRNVFVARVEILVSLLPHARTFARIPELFAGLVWLCWFGLLVWRTSQWLLRLFVRRTAPGTA